MTQPISILLCALGGEGGGVLADWLVDVARHAGYPAQATSIPGVAQRTGATTYYLEVYPLPHSQLQGRLPTTSVKVPPRSIQNCQRFLPAGVRIGSVISHSTIRIN